MHATVALPFVPPDRGSPAQVLALLGVAIGVVALLPGVLVGVATAAVLRRGRLSWVWALVGVPPAVGGLAVAWPTHTIDRGVSEAIAGEPGPLMLVLAPWWPLAAVLVAAAVKLHGDRRARLHGGRGEREAEDPRGPLGVWRDRRANRRSASAGPCSPDGVLVGVDDRGRLVRVPVMQAHGTIVGGSNTGKTNTAEVLLEGHVAAGAGFVILDGKGGQGLPRATVALGARFRRPVALWSLGTFGDPALDALRVAWNVTGGGNPTEIKDRIVSGEEQSEPYYAAIAARGVLLAAQALSVHDGRVGLDGLADGLERPKDVLTALLMAAGAERFAGDLAWLDGLNDKELSGLRGMGLRLRTMVDSDGGQWLLPHPDGRELDLERAIRDGWLVVFSLPQGTYPHLIPHLTRYVVAAINSVCTRLETRAEPANAVVFVDELSALDGEHLCATYERARSAGVRVLVATQSLSNLHTAGGQKLLHAALDNAELLVVHRQAVPDAAELLASVGGTEEAWEHTHQVTDTGALTAGLGARWGLDESGQRARRLTDRFRAHPNTIKNLGRGEAIVISTRPRVQVRQLTIRPGPTAQTTTRRTPR